MADKSNVSSRSCPLCHEARKCRLAMICFKEKEATAMKKPLTYYTADGKASTACSL